MLRTFYLGILASFYSITAMGEPVNQTGQEFEAAPTQSLSAVEENSRLAAHGSDRHYTNGAMLAYTTGTFIRSPRLTPALLAQVIWTWRLSSIYPACGWCLTCEPTAQPARCGENRCSARSQARSWKH